MNSLSCRGVRRWFAALLLGLAVLCTGFGLGLRAAQTADAAATAETKSLFTFLQRLAAAPSPKILFGHQLSTASGVGWVSETVDRSDVKTAVGDFPAVYGWDFGKIAVPGSTRKLESGSVATLRQAIIAINARGGINTISWHMPNPVNGGSFYTARGKGVPSESAVSRIVPGASAYDPVWGERFNRTLDVAADFFLSLRDERGNPVPVIFRPWHEQSGGWFWWGRGQRSADPTKDAQDYVLLWQYTVSYLRGKGVHNLLYAFSPSAGSWDFVPGQRKKLGTPPAITAWDEYPGDDWIDILGIDTYTKSDEGLRLDLRRLDEVIAYAQAHRKIAAITECGVREGITVSTDYARGWYMRLLAQLAEKPERKSTAYLLVWANRKTGARWVPVAAAGDDLADFAQFYADGRTVFERECAVLRRGQGN